MKKPSSYSKVLDTAGNSFLIISVGSIVGSALCPESQWPYATAFLGVAALVGIGTVLYSVGESGKQFVKDQLHSRGLANIQNLDDLIMSSDIEEKIILMGKEPYNTTIH